MSENRFSCGSPGSRETVSIETNRIMDCCRDRDCYENVRVVLTECGNDIIQHSNNVRVREAVITSANIAIDPVQFNRGFYAVNIRYFIRLCLEACTGSGRSSQFEGVAVVDKRAILFGGESNVSIFRSGTDATEYCAGPGPIHACKNVPIAVVEVVDPIILSAKVVESVQECRCCICCSGDLPQALTASLDAPLDFDDNRRDRFLAVSLGIFSVVRIVRPAEYLINAAEYSVPDKECVAGDEDDPCCIFRNMAFPTSEFSPTGSAVNVAGNCPEMRERRCGC